MHDFLHMLTQFSGFGNNFSLRKTFSSVQFFSLVDFFKGKHGLGIFENESVESVGFVILK